MRKFFGFVVVCMVFVGFAHPVGAMDDYNRNEITADSDDACPRDYFTHGNFAVICEDDYPCDVVIARTFTGECWWHHVG